MSISQNLKHCLFPALLVLGMLCPLYARNGSEPLNHYGLTVLQDENIGIKLMGRFKAKGQPVFLVHDPNLGLKQGDILRFQDKAVLIDADVWQTLQDEGALSHLKVSPLVRVQAKATVATWETRSKLVTATREKKAYQFGAELLKILESTFGGIPAREQLSIVFDGSSLILMAPDAFVDQLKYSTVRRVPQLGTPRFVSLPPEKAFLGRPFQWQAWAADPAEPAGTLSYSLFGELPKGLTWNTTSHSLTGIPEIAGSWKLLAEVRNKSGLFDTMAVYVHLRQNTPPSLAQPPKLIAVAGQLWDFHADAIDADHEGSQIKFTPLKMPPGMNFDSLTHRFQWYPSADRGGEIGDFQFLLEDPEGGKTELRFAIKIISATDMLWTEGIKLNLPWDTLRQGRTYLWESGTSALAWQQQGITLTEISGPDFTQFENGSLQIKPMLPQPFTLNFVFDILGKRVEQSLTLPVNPDLPPSFKSEIGAWRLRTGENTSYRPVAVDDGREEVSIEAHFSGDSPMTWDGERLRLRPEFPGTYTARFTATDAGGQSTEQWVVYQVEKAERPLAWFLESNLQSGINTYLLTADFGTGRMGIFTAGLTKIGRESESGQVHWPYIVFGGNLLGRENEKRGRRLWVDAGMTMRLPNTKVATGGIYGRLLGEWTFPGAAIGRVEFEITGHVNQAVILADTSNLSFIHGDAILEFAQKYSPVIDGIIKEATAKDNMVLFSRLEAWSRLGGGFWAGPGVWREEMPNAHHYTQRLGGGLRYEARFGEALAMHSLRVGWGSGGAGWSVHWNGRLAYHSPF